MRQGASAHPSAHAKGRRAYAAVAVAAAALIATPAAPQSPAPPPVATLSVGPRPLITGRHGMVSSNQPLASAAGLRVLMKGGNAFDAAVATAAATGVVDSFNSTLGGNGFATIYVARTKEVRALNFFGPAPRAARANLFTKETLNKGILASVVPSNLRGYQELLEKYGTMTFAQVLEPAIDLAENGFLVTPEIAYWIGRLQENFKPYPTSAAVYLPGDKPPAVGSLFVQRDYARTLRQVAQRGADDFYGGDIARRIAAFYKGQGGILDLEDLRAYRARWVDPLSVSYRGYQVFTQPPNSSAVAMLLELNMLEGLDLKALGHNSPGYIHHFMEVIRLSLADRNRFVADSDAVSVPLARLTSKDYARQRLKLIDPTRAPTEVTAGDLATSDGDTTHITVVDEAGNMVALTQTLGGPYGSYVVVGDTGLLFSNQMRHMHLDPESPSQIRGGARPRSNQSPTIVLRDGQAVLALGSPGGDPIWQRLPQVLANVIDFGMNIQDAVDAPRFTFDGPQETATRVKSIWKIEERIPAATRDQLRALGHELKVVPAETGPLGLGGVTGVMRDPRTGLLTGGADSRSNSYAIGY